jgi:CubicO group peptidase (beta-lactamase class C family)
LVAELFRRVEGRSLTVFVEEEFVQTRGWDIHIGLPVERDSDAAEVSVSETLDLSIRENASELQHRVFTSPFLEPLDANTVEWKRAELPSANGFSNAGAVAALYAAVIDLDEPLISGSALQQATKARYEGSDLILTVFSRWAAGFALNTHGVYGPNSSSFGHSGMGGSFGFADPISGIAMSYTPNRMGYRLRADLRAQALVDAVYECLGSSSVGL